ncbi:MAG TPA: hypothetical protein VHP33_33150 [Polyangiaceae bacterium]|nr:hypothetical protein [Polyangiaceae bacterium]
MAARVWAKWLVPSLALVLACGSSNGNSSSGVDPDVSQGSGGTAKGITPVGSGSSPTKPSKGGAPSQIGGEGPLEAGAGPDIVYGGAPSEVVAGAGGASNAEAGITLITSGEPIVHEAYGKLQLQLRLTAEPRANVEVGLKSADTSRATVSPLKLLFTPDNWEAPQNAFVSGVKDLTADGDHLIAIETLPAVSSDARYAGINAEDVSVWVLDDTEGGIVVGAVSGNTSEAGAQAQFYVVLTSKPTAKVVIPLFSSDLTEGTVPPELTFDPSDWSEPKAVTIVGVDDAVTDGSQKYQIMFGSAVSDDEVYAGRVLSPIDLVNLDNDSAG